MQPPEGDGARAVTRGTLGVRGHKQNVRRQVAAGCMGWEPSASTPEPLQDLTAAAQAVVMLGPGPTSPQLFKPPAMLGSGPISQQPVQATWRIGGANIRSISRLTL